MEHLANGVFKFQREIYPQRRELFQKLATGQSPSALFITCADSRIDPTLITQQLPGELFICRNAGNMVPPHNEVSGGVAATIDYAVAVLGVRDIIVCGHTDCGAMKALQHPEKLEQLPTVKSWMAHGELARQIVKDAWPDLPEHKVQHAITEQNVVAQLQHLNTYPSIASRLVRGLVRIHGWVYNIGTGEVSVWDADRTSFIELKEYSMVGTTHWPRSNGYRESRAG